MIVFILHIDTSYFRYTKLNTITEAYEVYDGIVSRMQTITDMMSSTSLQAVMVSSVLSRRMSFACFYVLFEKSSRSFELKHKNRSFYLYFYSKLWWNLSKCYSFKLLYLLKVLSLSVCYDNKFLNNCVEFEILII